MTDKEPRDGWFTMQCKQCLGCWVCVDATASRNEDGSIRVTPRVLCLTCGAQTSYTGKTEWRATVV